MKEVEYQIKINSLINKLPPEKLRDKLLSIAYNVPSDRWDEFISYFDGDDLNNGIDNPDVTLIKDGFDRALLFLDELIEEDIYLTRVYTRTSGLVDDSHLEDAFKIEEQMHSIFILVDRFVNEKEYSKALAIYSKLKDLYIPVQDAEYEMLSYSLEEYYSDSNQYEEDIAHVGTRALYCIYAMKGNLDIKITKFNDYLNSPLCRSVTAENFIKENTTEYKNLENFLLTLIPILFKTTGSKSLEWIHSIAPISSLIANIGKYHQIHPKLFRILMKKFVDNKKYEDAYKVGNKALEMMDKNLVERSKVANFLLSISLYLRGKINEDDLDGYYYSTSAFNLEEYEIHYLLDRFESRSTINNFLSLYRNIFDNDLIKKRLLKFLTVDKNILVNEDEDNEFITNVINRDVIAMGLFILNPNFKDLEKLKLRYSSYDREYKNIMIDMFLLFLSQREGEIPYLFSIATSKNELGYDKNLYVKFELTVFPKLMDGLLNWISDTVFKLTEALLENQVEKYYLRTAKIIKALDVLLKNNNISYNGSSVINYYTTKYPESHKFIKALYSLK